MEKTTKYSMFKKHSSNREIDPSNLKRIINSIQARDLLSLRPIVVNSNMEVIDGQHRLEAAKILQIPIYYTVKTDSTHEDILLLNINQKGWATEDYLKYFISLDNPEYIKFQNFVDREKITFREAASFLRCSGKFRRKLFYTGAFKFPVGQDFNEIMETKKEFDEVISFITSQKIEGSKICSKVPFKQALLEFLRSEDISFETFTRKLSMNLDKIRLCSGPSSYLMMLRDIYNWKNKDPVLF